MNYLHFLRPVAAAVLLTLTLVASRAQTSQPPIDFQRIVGSIGCDTNILGPINAISVVNDGTICASSYGLSFLPYEFTNNRFFVNNGFMQGFPGYRFVEFGPQGSTQTPFQSRRPMESFVNNGSIFVDAGGFTVQVTDGAAIVLAQPSFIIVESQDIRNRGLLSASGEGFIRMIGSNINLTNSALQIRSVEEDVIDGLPLSFHWINPPANSFSPEVLIYDVVWGSESSTNQPTVVYDGTLARSASHLVTNVTGNAVRRTLAFEVAPENTFYKTNLVNDTNLYTQGVFVAPPPDFLVDVRWVEDLADPLDNGVPAFSVPVVRLRSSKLDPITGEDTLSQYVIYDQLARSTNYNLLSNIRDGTFRPAPYVITRSRPAGDPGWDFLTMSDLSPAPVNFSVNEIVPIPDPADPADTNLFWNPVGIPNVSTNQQVAYTFQIATALDFPPPSPFGSATNWIGRVEIFADTLDLNRTRIKAEGSVNINANELLGARRTVVDAPLVSLNLASRSELNISGFVSNTVKRVSGNVNLWSGIWTNSVNYEQVVPDPNSPDPTMPTMTTNTMTRDSFHHAFLVDARGISTEVNVRIQGLNLVSGLDGASIVFLDDPLSVDETFSINARNVIVNDALNLGATVYWEATNVVNVRNVLVTPSGSISLGALANLNLGGPDARYAAVTNQGSLFGFGIRINSDYFESSGSIFAFQNLLAVNADTALITGGDLSSASDVTFTNRILTISGTTVSTPDLLIFDVSENLSDAGLGSDNAWSAGGGLQLGRFVPNGSLLGTTISLPLSAFGFSEIVWGSPNNRGATAEGFTENLAIGRLVLDGGVWSLYSFRAPTAAPTVIYVDLLEVSPEVAADLENSIAIASNVTVVFGDIRVIDGEGLGAAAIAAIQDMSFLGGGSMRWVNYSGRNSSVEVTLPSGELAQVNRVWTLQDDDQDGEPNLTDPDALGALGISGLSFNRDGNTVSFSWNAPAGSTVYLERNANPRGPRWSVVKTFRNDGSKTQRFDSGALPTVGDQQSYYRLRLIK